MVEVIHYETANRNKTIGLFDIKVPILKPTTIILRKIVHVQSGERRWFNLPSFSREKRDGSLAYLKYFEFDTQIFNGQLLEALTEKVKDYCAKHGIEPAEAMNFDSFPQINENELPF